MFRLPRPHNGEGCHDAASEFLRRFATPFVKTPSKEGYRDEDRHFYGADADKPFFSIGSEDSADGTHGYAQLGHWRVNTTGVLGWSKSNGKYVARAWPDWITIPSFQDLADARHWHFIFAWLLAINGAFYLGWSIVSRHLQRDIVPTAADIQAINV